MSSLEKKPSFDLMAFVVKVRRAFFRLSLREKALLFLFVLALVGIWFSLQVDRHKSTYVSLQGARSAIQEQDRWLQAKPSIDEQYASLKAQIDLNALPSGEEAESLIDALVTSSGFQNFDLKKRGSEVGEELSFHTMTLRIQKAEYAKLYRFTEALKEKLPFVSLESITLGVQGRDERYLDAVYILKSIEHTTK